ncbi:DNA topoisomerase [miscellaneous Crenarchaeota group-15 archaeon DG-45]|uniref:DNA topoisomerase (ATP-hydrolyzing) n=1 Tax=miscellaneous Crenarchaeota group-15 archaeon DG-45 TaxID=1685127 RepID=A0A0M0BT42_9ARCH|nr:MAG: DNA topoisomerase [miscellaneous Crenarchaeota group-15 archaeon DG-45]
MPDRIAEEAERPRESAGLYLKQLGNIIYEQLMNREFPWIMMQSRSTDNIIYDPDLRQYVLGGRTIRRHSRNIGQIRPFTQLVWTAWFGRELLRQRRTSTLREVYYSARGQRDIEFKNQSESDNIITDLETALNMAREDFNIFPEERSAIFGDLTIEYTVPGYEGRRMNLTEHPDGVMIGPALTSSEFVETTADKVLVIEKGAMFTRLVEERAHERFNAILIHTAGQSPRSTRSIIHRLNRDNGLPVWIFTDGDPWGVHIAMVIISGSANAAHLRGLATPEGRWLGVWATDIVDYKLPTENLTDHDTKRLKELREDPRYREELWQREIETFLKIGKKAELEAFSRYGLTYIVDEYLPAKLEGA